MDKRNSTSVWYPIGIELGIIVDIKDTWIEPSLYYRGTILMFEDYEEEGSSGDLSVEALGTIIVSDMGVKIKISSEIGLDTSKLKPMIIMGLWYTYYDAESTKYNLINAKEEMKLESYNYKGIYMSTGAGVSIKGENGISFGLEYKGDRIK